MSRVFDVMEECLKEHDAWIVKGDIIGWTTMKRDEVYLVDELEESSKIKGLKKEKQMKYDINKLPSGNDYDPPERIVAACNKYGDTLLVGVRHGSEDMYSLFDHVENVVDFVFKGTLSDREEQGFITSKYRFVTRQEAWKIAVEQQQIVRRVGGDTSNGGTLYSENLY